MAGHDRLAAHEFIHRWWFNYDEGNLDVLGGLATEDCHLRSRTELGNHPYEEFIASDSRGREAAMSWTRGHRSQSPYPLRHQASNVFVSDVRGEEIDLESYLFVTQIIALTPSPLSSGIVHWTLRLTAEGYRLRQQDVVLDSIESAPFHEVPHVSGRMTAR